MCRVNLLTTLEEQSIHIEESGHPGSLVCVVEGEDPAPVARLAWRYISKHPALCLHVQMQAGLPLSRRKKLERAVTSLLRKITHDRAA